MRKSDETVTYFNNFVTLRIVYVGSLTCNEHLNITSLIYHLLSHLKEREQHNKNLLLGLHKRSKHAY